MTPQEIAAALARSEQMLAGVSELHCIAQAAAFVRAVQLKHGAMLPSVIQLGELIGQPKNIEPNAAPLSLQGPTPEQVYGHVEQMFLDMARMNDADKRRRWSGFAAGAAAKVGCKSCYPLEHEGGLQDHAFFAALAYNTHSPVHNTVHYYLGFVQGWPWAGGHASIDDFRVVNNWPAKRSAA